MFKSFFLLIPFLLEANSIDINQLENSTFNLKVCLKKSSEKKDVLKCKETFDMDFKKIIEIKEEPKKQEKTWIDEEIEENKKYLRRKN